MVKEGASGLDLALDIFKHPFQDLLVSHGLVQKLFGVVVQGFALVRGDDLSDPLDLLTQGLADVLARCAQCFRGFPPRAKPR